MGRKKNEVEKEYLIENCFPKFDKFCIQWKEIVWEYIEEISEENPFPLNDNILIKSVAGFTNPGSLRKFINNQWLQGLNSIRKIFKDFPKKNSIQILENLIGLSEDLKNWVTSEFELDGKVHIKFNQWCMKPSAYHFPENFENLILRNAEEFPKAFLRSVDELVLNLMILKGEIESYEDDPLTFEYVGDDEHLKDLFDSMDTNRFINKESNTIAEFMAIFSGKPKINPIIWYGNKYELIFFIRHIKKKALIKKISNPANYIRNCFIDKNRKRYEASTLEKASPPGRTDELKNIVMQQLIRGK